MNSSDSKQNPMDHMDEETIKTEFHLDEKQKGLIQKAFQLALSVDPDAALEYVRSMKLKNPRLDNKQLAKKMIKRYRWLGASSGFVTGIPSNPMIALPAAAADLGAMLRVEIVLASRIALLFDENFLDAEEAILELLVPIFGSGITSQILRQLAGSPREVTRFSVRQVLNQNTWRQFRSLMFNYFAKQVIRRALFAKTIPIVGGLIGGVWNVRELHAVGSQAIDYFSGLTLSVKTE